MVRINRGLMAALPLLLLVLVGCTRESAQTSASTTPDESLATMPNERSYSEDRAPCANYTELRQPLFGDLHVHTSFSFDAAANSTGATPADAYRYARGEAIHLRRHQAA